MNSYIYDYIIIGSQYNESIYNQLLNMKVDKSKILQFYKFYDMLCNPVKACIDYYSIRVEEVEAIITGISYARSGVIYNNLYKKLIILLCIVKIYFMILKYQNIFYKNIKIII